MRRRRSPLQVLYPALVLLAVGCQPFSVTRIYHEHHCANNLGNASCIAEHGDALPYCGVGLEGCYPHTPKDGCLSERPAEDQCYSPCGGISDLASDPDQACAQFPPMPTTTTVADASSTSALVTTTSASTDDGDSSSSEESSSEVSSSSGAASGCLDDAECGVERPYCDLESGECRPCSAAEAPDVVCETVDASRPLCVDDECVACTDENSGACTDDTPACFEHTCVACTPDNLSGCTPEAPACDSGSNTCVACTDDDIGACGGDTPVCLDHSCVPCTAHEQCPADDPALAGAACDLQVGACFPSDSVWFVDGDAPCPGGNGTSVRPFCSLALAVEQLNIAGSGTIVVHERTEGGIGNYAGVTLEGSVRAAIIAAPGERPTIQGSDVPGLLARGSAFIYLDGLSFSRGTAEGIRVLDSASVFANELSVNNNGGVGISLSGNAALDASDLSVNNNGGIGIGLSGNATLDASRVRVLNNSQGGIVLGSPSEPDSSGTGTGSGSGSAGSDESGVQGASSAIGSPSLSIVNSFVNAALDTHALSVHEGQANILYTTLAGLTNLDETSLALLCDDNASVTARNSLFVSGMAPEEIYCPPLSASYCAAEIDLGGTNTALGDMTGGANGWFTNFGSGDLTLNNPPDALLTAALWQDDDPLEDIDGTARPAGPGESDVAGADVP